MAYAYKKMLRGEAMDVLSFAKSEVERRNAPAMEIEHLLYGMIRWEQRSGNGVLRALQLNLPQCQEWIHSQITNGPDMVAFEIGTRLTQAASKAVALAMNLAIKCKRTCVNADFLLLGILGCHHYVVDALKAEFSICYASARKIVAARSQVDEEDLIVISQWERDALPEIVLRIPTNWDELPPALVSKVRATPGRWLRGFQKLFFWKK
jgi:ATP-dependent Clp protease ATP-binding subunit ClpA